MQSEGRNSGDDDPARYGTGFAEVYDRWYPGGDEAAVCRFLQARLPKGARVLELGVGTGRVALPLAAAGFDVWGLDASTDMLDRLATKDPGATVTAVRADAGDPAGWSHAGLPGSFDAIVAACNLLLNLTATGAQAACVRGAGDLLAPGGLLVTELSDLEPPTAGGRGLEVSSVEADGVVLIATETDPATGLVRGRHLELRDGEAVRVRPWSIRVATVADLDRWCAAAGLHLESRHPGWDHSAGDRNAGDRRGGDRKGGDDEPDHDEGRHVTRHAAGPPVTVSVHRR